jgi:hypothetical protein
VFVKRVAESPSSISPGDIDNQPTLDCGFLSAFRSLREQKFPHADTVVGWVDAAEAASIIE